MIKVQKILCPVDFFPASLTAAQYAAGLAANYGSTVHLLHIITPRIRTAYEYPLDIADSINAMERAARAEMLKLAAELRAKGVDVESEIEVGDVRQTIKQSIATLRPDMVAMGTHGRHGVDRWVMGSITEWMIRHSPVPVLTISSKEKSRGRGLRRIMVTTDFSDGTADALNYALSIAETNKSQVTLVHIVDPSSFELPNQYREILIKGLQKQLDSLFPAEVRERSRVRTNIRQGVPYRMILAMMKVENTDLLVMNIHGRGMIDRALLGSTAERVVRGAQCPVILIPAIPKAKATEKPGAKRAAA